MLFDALRKVIQLIACLCSHINLSTWRQNVHLVKKAKKLLRKIQKIKKSTSKDPNKKLKREKEITKLYQEYLTFAKEIIIKYDNTKHQILQNKLADEVNFINIDKFKVHAERQIDQIHRRVILGEKIPHEEKIFSIFEEHTEWIVKGKAGVAVELGVKVCVVEDQFNFILNHTVMQKITDDKVCVALTRDTKEKYPDLNSCSYDKGFYSLDNKEKLSSTIDDPILPKKGRRSKEETKRESTDSFIKARKQHSAVESAINALEVHGLNKCPDHGIFGFKRYIGLAIVARNLQRIGAVLQKKASKQSKRSLRRAA